MQQRYLIYDQICVFNPSLLEQSLVTNCWLHFVLFWTQSIAIEPISCNLNRQTSHSIFLSKQLNVCTLDFSWHTSIKAPVYLGFTCSVQVQVGHIIQPHHGWQQTKQTKKNKQTKIQASKYLTFDSESLVNGPHYEMAYGWGLSPMLDELNMNKIIRYIYSC